MLARFCANKTLACFCHIQYIIFKKKILNIQDQLEWLRDALDCLGRRGGGRGEEASGEYQAGAEEHQVSGGC